jgi:mRNA interferase MazF
MRRRTKRQSFRPHWLAVALDALGFRTDATSETTWEAAIRGGLVARCSQTAVAALRRAWSRHAREPSAATASSPDAGTARETAGASAGTTQTIRRGDLFWITPDGSEGDVTNFPHPHVVVQDDVFNVSRIRTVVVCALTTNLRRATEPGNVLLDAGEGNLPKPSVVVVSQIASVEKTRLGERIGALSEERVDQIVAGLRFQQRSFFER